MSEQEQREAERRRLREQTLKDQAERDRLGITGEYITGRGPHFGEVSPPDEKASRKPRRGR